MTIEKDNDGNLILNEDVFIGRKDSPCSTTQSGI